jgi:hypothetical protein
MPAGRVTDPVRVIVEMQNGHRAAEPCNRPLDQQGRHVMKIARPGEYDIGGVAGGKAVTQPRSQGRKRRTTRPKAQRGPQIFGCKHPPSLVQNLTGQNRLPGRQIVELQNGGAHGDLRADTASKQGVQELESEVDFLVGDVQRWSQRDDVLVVAADVQDQAIGL